MLGVLVSILSSKYFDSHSFPVEFSSPALVLDNINLIPISEEGVVPNRQLVISDGKIIDIKPAGSPAMSDFLLIDMGGAYVMPGLFDMHVHIDDRQQLRLALAYGVTSVRNMDGMPFHL